MIWRGEGWQTEGGSLGLLPGCVHGPAAPMHGQQPPLPCTPAPSPPGTRSWSCSSAAPPSRCAQCPPWLHAAHSRWQSGRMAGGCSGRRAGGSGCAADREAHAVPQPAPARAPQLHPPVNTSSSAMRGTVARTCGPGQGRRRRQRLLHGAEVAAGRRGRAGQAGRQAGSCVTHLVKDVGGDLGARVCEAVVGVKQALAHHLGIGGHSRGQCACVCRAERVRAEPQAPGQQAARRHLAGGTRRIVGAAWNSAWHSSAAPQPNTPGTAPTPPHPRRRYP